MTRILHPLLALLACATRQELARQVAYLKEENRIFRDRLPKRIVATDNEKRRLIKAGRKLGAQLKELTWRLHYNRERPHEGRAGHLPPGCEKPPEPAASIRATSSAHRDWAVC